MSYRAFALGTVLAAPVLVMVVQSFTAEHRDKGQVISTSVAPATQSAAVVPTTPAADMPAPVQEAPSGPTPVFGQPLAGAGQPATPLGDTPPSNASPIEGDTSQNF